MYFGGSVLHNFFRMLRRYLSGVKLSVNSLTTKAEQRVSPSLVAEEVTSSNNLPENDMCNPYLREGPKCFLCAHKIELDYKNARLLQQFVSSFSGRVYDRYARFC